MTKSSDEYSEEEADRRFRAAVRNALATPHRPLNDMVGKVGRKAKSKPIKKRQKKA